MQRNDNGTTTGSAKCRTIIGQTAIDAEKGATIARLTAELAESGGEFAIRALTTTDATAALATIRAEAEKAGMMRALGAIAKISTPTNEDIMRGHEDDYRAVAALDTTPNIN